jgi:hypothetical protein
MLLGAVDGIHGARKSTFADELADALAARGVVVVRASIDSLNQTGGRAMGARRKVAEGFYSDWHDLTDHAKSHRPGVARRAQGRVEPLSWRARR